jgi:predicted Zn-dependent peptidase
VIIEENIKSQDDSENMIHDNSEYELYNGSSYEHPIDTLDYHKKPNSLNYADVIKTYRDYYQPERMVLSVVSHVPFHKVKTILKTSSFMKASKEHPTYSQPKLFLEPQTEIKYNIQRKPDISALHLCVSFRTCPNESNDTYILDLLNEIVGSSFSSRLFTILREDNGLTYSSSSSTNYYPHSGDFSINVTLNPEKIFENGKKKGVFPLIIDLLNDLLKNGVTKEEIVLFKGYVKGQHHIEMEDSYNKCEYNGTNLLLYGEQFTPFEKIFETHYKHISKPDIDSIIKKYFKKANMVVCLLASRIPSLEKIKRHTERFLG